MADWMDVALSLIGLNGRIICLADTMHRTITGSHISDLNLWQLVQLKNNVVLNEICLVFLENPILFLLFVCQKLEQANAIVVARRRPVQPKAPKQTTQPSQTVF